jgi:hypothetical protein
MTEREKDVRYAIANREEAVRRAIAGRRWGLLRMVAQDLERLDRELAEVGGVHVEQNPVGRKTVQDERRRLRDG